MDFDAANEKIVKFVLHTGTKNVDFVPGTKVLFHFRTTKCNVDKTVIDDIRKMTKPMELVLGKQFKLEVSDAIVQKMALNEIAKFRVLFHFRTTKCDVDKTVIDDSRKMTKPMELVLGKQFKLEVWEAIVQKMALNEIAKFRVNKSLVAAYPFVSKTLREVGKPQSEKRNRHCCGVTLQNEGIGYEDLNELIKNPQDLEFTIELLQVVPPTEYDKESWQMTETEKLDSIPDLREKGNKYFKEKDYKLASQTYASAIGILEQLMLAEKPNDEEWLALNAMKIPLLLNYAQCKLIEKEYYSVIEHCTTVLKSEPDNVKALYRRGKAHIGAWNETEAARDLKKAAEFDPTLKIVVEKELQAFALAIREKENKQKKTLSQMFS